MSRIRKGVFFCLVLSFAFATAAASAPRLRVSLPPVLASLPIAFAEEWGLFDERGVDVEIIGLTDNQLRSAALATGDLDLVIEDVTQFIVDLSGGQRLLATSAAYVRPQSASMEVALVSPGSFRLDTLDELIEARYLIGTLFRSDHEYLLDQLLAERIEDRTEWPPYSYATDVLFLATWFGAQAIPAAVLPEPYVSYIATYVPPGGRSLEIVTLSRFEDFEVLPDLLVFRADYVERSPEAVIAFYAAYVDAIKRINATSRDELIETGLDVVLPLFFQGANPDTIGQDVLDAISIPSFDPPAELPRTLYENVLEWMDDKGYAFVRPAYDEVVDGRFLR